MSKHTLIPRGEQYLMTMSGEDYDHARKCVNLHEDLVEALTNLQREYCQAECYGNDYGINGVKHKNYCLAASKAIAKAKGGK